MLEILPKEYCIIQSSDHTRMEDAVNTKLQDGWELQGGVSLNEYMHRSVGSPKQKIAYCQAMYRQPCTTQEPAMHNTTYLILMLLAFIGAAVFAAVLIFG